LKTHEPPGFVWLLALVSLGIIVLAVLFWFGVSAW
jgi:hypothetical protein